MREKDLQEDLATLAYKAEADHEVQMARADLYKIAKYAIQMHEMLKGVTEEQGLEGWVQSKITKAADYLGAVYHHMDYEQKFESVAESTDDDVEESGIMYKAGVKKYGKDGMKKIQSAAGKGASAEEIGAIKDKHNKKKKESIDENQVPASSNVLKLVVGDYKKLKAEQDLMAKQGYDEDVEMIERRLKDLRQMAELIKEGGYLAGVDTAVADDIVDYYKRAGEPLPFARESVEESYTDTLAFKLEEAKKQKGLYYNVNKRKKAGTSRSKNHPDAPSEKDWENAAKTAKESKETKCPDCNKPSYKTLPEEKQKGVDGKVCWKGYKRMGTKKKGGKTVDNCVKM